MKKNLRIAFFIFFTPILFSWPSRAGLKDWIQEKLPYKLPPEKLQFEKLKPSSNSAVLDRNGEILFYIPSDRLKFYKPLSEISLDLQKFVVLSEDAKFFDHEGFDLNEIESSLKSNLSSNKIKRGGSTITQQLAKNLFLDKKRSVTRKLFEVPWTLQIERDLSKKQILDLYLNIIEWGPGIYGAEAASRHFFDKPAKELSLRQALYLSLIVPNPPRFDLFGHPETLSFLEKKKKNFVERIYKEKKISLYEKNELLKENFELASTDNKIRIFPLQHSGNYAGKSKSLNKNWQDLASFLKEKNLESQKEIKTSLLKNFEESLPKTSADFTLKKNESYLVWRDERGVQSFKKIDKKEKIIEPSLLPSGLNVENDFSLEEVLHVTPPLPSTDNTTRTMEGG